MNKRRLDRTKHPVNRQHKWAASGDATIEWISSIHGVSQLIKNIAGKIRSIKPSLKIHNKHLNPINYENSFSILFLLSAMLFINWNFNDS